ncbi:DUF4389 domain-containing protein [Microbulbifer harenosus]|uniref:DUF4389 domain-containing protein n=1 Tax=Microbulbifer harenosus TaxID=2576840 RepID=A0ABY2UF58_9GAMM|nr:DUF4389 domain-containing protein [Microbulbifer harenosus]TLM76096.1 DUF4389 domain-containing protein [Microbulbifer harenosus]
MSNEELKRNLTSTNQWLRLVYMVLFAVLLEVAGFVMLAVIIAQFLFAIFSGGANDNLRRLGDQISTFIYQSLQFLIYNTEEKPFPFSEWPESEEEDLSSYESAEEIDGEVIGSDDDVEVTAEFEEVDEAPSARAEQKPQEKAEEKPAEKRKPKAAKSGDESAEDETVIELGSDTSADVEKNTGDK